MTPKLKYSLLCLLAIGTVALIATYWHLGMAGMTTFLLAYFSKGMRRDRVSCLDAYLNTTGDQAIEEEVRHL